MSIKDILFNHLNDNDVINEIMKEKKLQEIEDETKKNHEKLVDFINANFIYFIRKDEFDIENKYSVLSYKKTNNNNRWYDSISSLDNENKTLDLNPAVGFDYMLLHDEMFFDCNF